VSPPIRFSRKETRKLAKEAEDAGFVYVGDDSKGHAEFEHPTGVTLSLSETPGNGQIKRVRDIIARATGKQRGPYDPKKRRAADSKARQEQRALVDRQRAATIRAVQIRNAAVDRAILERKVARRYGELKSIESLMGCRAVL
jgi:hypothetical protein